MIDALSESIQRFGISKNKTDFDDQLDFIMTKMKKIEIELTDEHWVTLKSNYSKLKYLNEIINCYGKEYRDTKGKFIQSLTVFMESIDKTTQYYLREINWSTPELEFKDESAIIQNYFYESLNQNDPILKLSNIVKAYNILIPIVENIRNEFSEVFLEPDFLELFQPPEAKRTKR